MGCALAFARAGAGAVILVARRADRLELAAQTIRAASPKTVILALAVDLRNPGSVRRAADLVRDKHGSPDIVCCTAGAGSLSSVEEAAHDDFYENFQSSCFTAFNVVKEFLPAMIAAGRGHVVLAGGSPLIHLPHPAAGFIASRSALRGFARALEEDLHDTDVRVTYCEMGPLAAGSSYYRDNPGSAERLPLARARDTWLKRLLSSTAEEAGRSVVDAVSRDASFLSPPLHRLLSAAGAFCLTRPVLRLILRLCALPPHRGGGISGHRRQMWDTLYSAPGNRQRPADGSARALSSHNRSLPDRASGSAAPVRYRDAALAGAQSPDS